MSEKVFLYGKNPLKEAILATKSDTAPILRTIYLTKASAEDSAIVSLLQKHSLSYEIVTGDEIESMVGRGAIHQGVCALLDESALYSQLDEMLEKVKMNSTKNRVFVLLDELQDPHNVGAIIRSAVAFGADAILMPEHDQVQINGTVIKASSGMVFKIPIVRIGNINTTLRKLKDETFWIYGLTGNGDTNLTETKFDSNAVIVIGSEGSGIRAKTLELCDFKLSIKIDELCESLNASNAVAVTLYEWRKQNHWS
jgi:23S rRNA (guanosine2251-2'-O)-methyltransferase